MDYCIDACCEALCHALCYACCYACCCPSPEEIHSKNKSNRRRLNDQLYENKIDDHVQDNYIPPTAQQPINETTNYYYPPQINNNPYLQ